MTCSWLAHGWLTDCLTDRQTDLLTDLLPDWLMTHDSLTDWLDSLQLSWKVLTVWIGHGLCRIGPCLSPRPHYIGPRLYFIVLLYYILLYSSLPKIYFSSTLDGESPPKTSTPSLHVETEDSRDNSEVSDGFLSPTMSPGGKAGDSSLTPPSPYSLQVMGGLSIMKMMTMRIKIT